VGENAPNGLTLRELRESDRDAENGRAEFLLCMEHRLLACPQQLTPMQCRDIVDILSTHGARLD